MPKGSKRQQNLFFVPAVTHSPPSHTAISYRNARTDAFSLWNDLTLLIAVGRVRSRANHKRIPVLQLVPVQKLPTSTEKHKPGKISLLLQAPTRELIPAAVFLEAHS